MGHQLFVFGLLFQLNEPPSLSKALKVGLQARMKLWFTILNTLSGSLSNTENHKKY